MKGLGGKERDNEIKEPGNSYDFGARIYEPCVGRWLSIDPMANLREWLWPYNFVQNNPLNRIDPDGRFDWVANKDGEENWDENAINRKKTPPNQGRDEKLVVHGGEVYSVGGKLPDRDLQLLFRRGQSGKSIWGRK